MPGLLKLILFSRSRSSLRTSIVVLVGNFLFISGLVFLLELVVIGLGMTERFIPLTRTAHALIAAIVLR